MFALVLLFVKGLLVPFHDVPPTDAEIQAFEDYEDTHGYRQVPTPTERYEMAVEWHDEMVTHSLWTLLRWRLAVAWMPFCKGEQRLIGEWASRKLFPNLWQIRRERKIKAHLLNDSLSRKKADW